MSQSWMPIFRDNSSAATPGMLLYGSATTLVALWIPLFETESRRTRSYSLWDLGEVGAPGLPLLLLGAALLVVAGGLLHFTHVRVVPGMWLSCLAVAETLGILVALSAGFAVTLPDADDIEFRPGLLLLVAGLTVTLVGTRRLPKSTGRVLESSSD
ncbi:hypothetical protein ACFV24_13075 [Nocardia fluminea]|uniref:hypothetical protein n=1 Tax=Nocardia fluminea TaxID=134984 RepID=UPI00366D0CAA